MNAPIHSIGMDKFDPSSRDFHYNPGPQYLALRDAGRLVWFDGWQCWVMTRLDDIVDCWRTEYLSSDYFDWEYAPQRPPESEWNNFERALIGHTLVGDKPKHRKIRKIVSPAFSKNVVDEIQRRIEPDVKRIFDEIGTPESFDYVENVAKKIPFISISRIIGLPEKYWDDVKPVVANFTDVWNPILPPEVRQQAVEDSNRAIDIFHKVIAERRLEPQENDFLSTLIKISDENEDFDDWDIVTLILALLGAGSDTTMIVQSWIAYALTINPEQREQACSNQDEFHKAFRETVRWSGINKMGFARYAPEDMEVCGQPVKKGQMIAINPDLNGFDPELFPEPEKFDINRDYDKDLLFGYGPRFCIGAALAKNQLFLTISELFKRFPDIEVLEEPERDLEEIPAIIFKSLKFKTNCK